MAKSRKKEEYVVIGLGRFGSSLARSLEQFGHTVFGIDIHADPVQEIASDVTQAASLDATNEDALKAVDIASFDTAIVAIGDDFEASVLTTASLKNLGVRHVICKADTDRQREILLRIGADRVVQPEQSGGVRLAEELSSPSMLERVPLGPKHSLAEVIVPESLIFQSLSQCDLRNRFGVTVLVIQRGEDVLVSPPPETLLQPGDLLILLGEDRDVTAFSKLT